MSQVYPFNIFKILAAVIYSALRRQDHPFEIHCRHTVHLISQKSNAYLISGMVVIQNNNNNKYSLTHLEWNCQDDDKYLIKTEIDI